MRCAVSGCKNHNKKKKTSIMFFRFPKDEFLRNIWIKACNKPTTINPKNARMCSAHFGQDCFVRQFKESLVVAGKGFKVTPGSIPTLCLPTSVTKDILVMEDYSSK